MFKKDPEGYKNLLVYKKADELHQLCLDLAEKIKAVGINKILYELADQIGRAARSPKSNIVEGWKRNSTKEYFDYLSFSIASVAEIEEDATDIIKGKYKELMGVKGIMGITGFINPSNPSNPLHPLFPLTPFTLEQVEKLPFYPLDPSYPLVIQIKLKCKELSMLLYKLQKSLDQKMTENGDLSMRAKLKNMLDKRKEEDEWLKSFLPKKEG